MRSLFSLLLFALIVWMATPPASGETFGVVPKACSAPDSTRPKLTDGYLMCFLHWTTFDVSGPNVFVTEAKSGRSVVATRIWPADVWKLELKDLAPTAQGYAAIGVAYSNSGIRTGFLALTDNAGKALKYVQLAPYLAYTLGVAPDGKLWMLGEYPPDDGVHREPYDVVRVFTADGTLLNTLIPRSSFKTRREPAMVTIEGAPSISSSPDRLGVFIPAASEWIELSFDGRVLTRIHVASPSYTRPESGLPAPLPKMMASSLVLTPSGEVYGTFQGGTGERMWRLDKQARQWEPLFNSSSNSPAGPPVIVTFIGNAGQKLVALAEDRETLIAITPPAQTH